MVAMKPDLRDALLACSKRGGSLMGYPDDAPDRRVLALFSIDDRPYHQFRLSWAEYFETFAYWQKLLQPRERRRKQRRYVA